MVTVNSLSGGKTSSYIAVHYPADYEVFALVCNEDPDCAHPDPSVMQYANDKLSLYTPAFGEVVGTPEDPKILTVMMDLEQKIGREIHWVRDQSFEQIMRQRKSLPNIGRRFCTQEMKLRPIFGFCAFRIGEITSMRIGFRYDEKERAERFTLTYDYPYMNKFYLGKSNTWRQRWKKGVEWRVGDFPLIEDGVFHFMIKSYWAKEDIDFPKDSNCQMCFWKPAQQFRVNFDENPAQMKWAKRMEEEFGATFHKKTSMVDAESMDVDPEFTAGVGSGCQAGFCTD